MPAVRLCIAAIEFLNGPVPPEVGICLRYGTDDELAALTRLPLKGATMRVE